MAELKIGLEGIAVAESRISHVDGAKGQLIYQGYLTEKIVQNHCYEDIVYLLWYGKLPNEKEAQEFKTALISKREVPEYIKKIISLLPNTLSPMAVLRSAISAMTLSGNEWPPSIDQAMEILAKAPTIIAYYHNLIHNIAERKPDPNLAHAANYLYMLHGGEPAEKDIKALDTYLMLSADHGMNASTFTARVITSTQSDIISAITGAIGALIGPLHGGAPSKVDDMLDQIGTEENAEPWLRSQLEQGKRLMGFGHRVYKTYDPRGEALKKVVEKYAHESRYFKLSLKVEKEAVKLLAEYKPGRNLYPNLEFWAAGVLRSINLPPSLYTPTFCLSRIAGWSAHAFEQSENNRLIRPSSIYVGPTPK